MRRIDLGPINELNMATCPGSDALASAAATVG